MTSLHLYRGWLRSKPARELMAMIGIAVGVALVFATITANLSVAGSANRIFDALTGSAQIQATARTQSGVQQRTVSIPNALTADVLEVPIAISYGGRQVGTQLVGAGASVAMLNPMVENVPPSEGLVLPEALALALNADRGSMVTIVARGVATRRPVRAVLGSGAIGPLAESQLAFAPLVYAQQLVGLSGRISTILVQAQPGHVVSAERALKADVEPAMQVTDAGAYRDLLANALKTQNESTLLFALLGSLIGLLLIVTTTMLTLADRRAEILELKLMGYSPRKLVRIVLSHGVILGGVSSLIGIGAGWLLAISVFRSNPAYLSTAFPFGVGTTISIPLAIGIWFAGVLTTCLCVGYALINPGVIKGNQSASGRLAIGAVLLLAISVLLVTSAPLVAALVLALAVFALVPWWLHQSLRIASHPALQFRWLTIAAGAIRANRPRSIGLAATAAIGVFGAVVAQGTHASLLNGLEDSYARYIAPGNVWVSSPSDDMATNPIPNIASRFKGVDGVNTVRPYYGGWFDMAGRRLWLIARSGSLPEGQVLSGNQTLQPGMVAISDQLARTLRAKLGSTVEIPTPTGIKPFRLGAITSNLGWSSGVLFLRATDYRRDWPDAMPTALEISGHPAPATIQRIAGAALVAQTSAERASVADRLPRQGLERLSQIAWLLVVAATIAVALALSASIWQRRGELASQRLQSFTPRQLQYVLAWEALLIVGSGAVLGALAGIYGHVAADRFMHESTGYPIVWSVGLPLIIETVLFVAATTLVILAAPGRLASNAPLRLATEGR